MDLEKILKDIQHDLVSRSGLTPGPYFKILTSIVIDKLWINFVNDLDNLPEYEVVSKFKEDFRNEFMKLLHHKSVERKHFNWF